MIKIIKKLLKNLAGAMVMVVLGSTLLYLSGWSRRGDLKLGGINWFNSSSWFVGYYLILMIIAALFLNKWLASDGMNHRRYIEFLLVLFAFTQFVFSRDALDSVCGRLSTIVLGVFLFSFGGYIRIYNPFAKVRTYALILGIVFANLLVCLTFYNLTITKINDYSDGLFIQPVTSWPIYSIICIVLAVLLFEIFRRITLPHSFFINFLASGTFFVYLLHDNDFFYSIWKTRDWITPLYNRPMIFCLKLMKWTLATFMVCFIAYCMFLLLCKVCKRLKILFIKS